MSQRTFIVSDVHLGAAPVAHEVAFLRFLDTAVRPGDELLINGDLFDFWFEYRHAVPAVHLRTFGRLRNLVDAGVDVSFVPGNHDPWPGAYLRDEVGLRLLEGPVRLSVGGRRAYIAHGDGLGTGDLGYRILRGAVRNRFVIGLFRSIHPDIGLPFARRLSHTEKRLAGGEDVSDGEEISGGGRHERLVAHARTILEGEPGIELVILGHSHRPALMELLPGQLYVNSGDWVQHSSYVVVTPSDVRLESWPLEE